MADILTIVDDGKKYFCDVQVGKRTPENISLALFVNDAAITDTTVIGDLTEMTTHGITPKVLTGATWPSSVINVSTQAETSYPIQDFIATTADDGVLTDVFGYFAKSATSGELLWAVKFDAAKPITYENEKISIIPTVRYDQKA